MDPFYDVQNFTWPAIFAGTSIAFLSFLGFDQMATLAEESIQARKTVNRALLIAVPLIAVIFILQTYVAAIIHPGYSFSDPNVAFYYIANEAGGIIVQMLALLGTVIAWGVCDILAVQAAVSRILFSMGKEGHVPKIFAKIHPKYKTPYVSTIIVALITAPIV